MKLKMAENSLFAVLLRSPWWISIAIAAVLALLAAALLPAEFRVVGAVSALPFVVIGAMAARRQWRLPSAAQVSQTLQEVGEMAWPEFSRRLEEAFQRQGYTVQRSHSGAVDFELQRQGRRTLVCAKRWKTARIGLEPLRALQAARAAADASDALFIGLGELTDTARPYAAEQGITVWQSTALAQALHAARAGRSR
ncbi:MAG: restriction endonuclease [Rubrivivax sp.]|nr:restriction endonuclease [Rubrivivax sp.]